MNKEKTIQGNVVELAFPRYEEEDDQIISKGGEGLVKHLSTSIDAITDWFKQYQVESIELWISGLVEASGITKLVVSAKGEGGLKVVLKPKSQEKNNTSASDK
jgi:hypothetical protein